MNVSEKLNAGCATTAEALELFDSLEPVDVDFMIGRWQGEGFHTGHPMDGLLEAYHWYGKRFESPEDVHPLVFSTSGGIKVPGQVADDDLSWQIQRNDDLRPASH
jgi:hypothetical protein